ncbi:S8 family serine peptidase [Fibrella sp. WM1]|uniref:S8 family serine peptidase n=1 Tax=Fibrella musci TaxID=3242485 RepID=UPI00352045E3
MGRNRYWGGLLLLLMLLLGARPMQAQRPGQYLLIFRDKANTPFSVSQPTQFLSARSVARRQRQGIAITSRDLPVTPAYVQGLRQAGARVLYTSRWLNAALVEANSALLPTLLALPYVQGLETGRVLNNVNARQNAAADGEQRTQKFGKTIPSYGQADFQLRQLGVDQMHEQGFRGEGMLVGILDAGFLRANQVPFLQNLFTEKRIVATYDFADRETDVYDDDTHGLNVLSVMAGELPNQFYGPAFKASYVLLRTEVAATENPVEEAYWLFGAEYADSVGVDVINSSLGYTTFDNPADNHTYADLTGTRTIVSRAATWAGEAGIVVVNSAGNEGNNAWRYIGAPADSPSILSIGAIDRTEQLASFSSVGPTPNGRLKPDLVALGVGTVLGSPNGTIVSGNGTSFSSPLVAALATGFWQAHPRLTAAQVRESLRLSGSQANSSNNFYGYGIPSFGRAAVVARRRYGADAPAVSLYPNPVSGLDPLNVFWSETDPGQEATIQIADLTGRVVYQEHLLSGQSFSVPFMERGLYLLTMTTSTKSRTVKYMRL